MRTRHWKSTLTIWVFVFTAIFSQHAQAFPCSSSIILCKHHPSTQSITSSSSPLVVQFQARNDNSNNDNRSSDTAAKVRFTASSSSSSSSTAGITTTNAFDAALSFISSDIVSIALGLLGICLLLIERFTLPDASTTGANEYQYAQKLSDETRSNLIAVLACGSVLLNGLSKLDVTSALAEAVELEGVILQEPLYFLDGDEQDANDSSTLRPLRQHKDTLDWAMQSLLQATPAKTVVILQATHNAGRANDQDNNSNSKWNIVSMAGTVPVEATARRPQLLPSTPILDRFQKDGSSRETYLPTLQALPGKTEFTYIPANTQEVLILSVPSTAAAATTTTAVMLGSHRAKSFTPRDVAWCQTLAARMGLVFYGQ